MDAGEWDRGNSHHKYLLQMTREQMSFSATLSAIREMERNYSPARMLIENKACGPAVIGTLRKEIGHRLDAVEPQRGKSDRAYAVVPQFERGEVWFPNPKIYLWVKSLLTEMQSFPKSVTDDCVNAMTQFLISREANRSPAYIPSNLVRRRDRTTAWF